MGRLRFRRPAGALARIPTASMADIAFLLLIFFLTSSIFRLENGLPVQLPRAESGVRVARQGLARIWVDRQGSIVIDDRPVAIESVEAILRRKLAESSGLVVSLQVDRETPYQDVDRLLAQIKLAGVRNVSFGNRPETGGE